MLLTEIEDDFISVYNSGIDAVWNQQTLQLKNIDFIFELDSRSDGIILRYITNSKIYLPSKEFNLREFENTNPFLITISFTSPDKRKFLYGKTINSEILNDISQRINSDIALIWNGYPADFSNQSLNQKYLYVLGQAVDNLKSKNNFELYIQGTESKDILATIYKPATEDNQNDQYFLIFSTFAEAGELRSTLKGIFIVIGLVGISLSLIFTMVFTDKLRKQVVELSKATEQTYSGKFDYKIEVKSKDEIGKLGMAFNKMLEELKKKEIAKKDYADFITLINQNPTLKEISDVALKKILETGDFLIGGLYSIDDEINLISTYGLSADYIKQPQTFTFFKKVLDTKECFELYDEEMLPIISTGLIDIKIKYLLFLPIIYNNKPVALLELGSLSRPSEEVRDYLEKIKDQLAIGITNARALLQLEKLVGELKSLNEEYHKQNVQIKEQNETLLNLHTELKSQAEELEKQKQKAIELTDAKSKFLANMSHELRTPMNSILGLTELMLEKVDLEPRNRERLEVVLNSGKRLMTLINDILDLSKIEAGKIELVYEDVILDEILNEVTGAIAPLANEKGLNYEILRNIDTNTLISTDRGKVVQVLINLLGNAVKYTDKGNICLGVSVGNEMLNFEVIDTGIGIPEEEINLIFEEFQQVNSSKSKKRGGTGLGLAICKKLTDILKGNISVKSELNKGSVFTFSIPYNQIEMFSANYRQVISSSPSISRNGNHSVLVVDQDRRLRNYARQYFNFPGYEIIFSETGKNLHYEKNNPPYAIILDMNLTQGDCWDILVDLLYDKPASKKIPVIPVYFLPEKNFFYAYNALDYIPKPIFGENPYESLSNLEYMLKKKVHKIVIVDDDDRDLSKYKYDLDVAEIKLELIQGNENTISMVEEIQPDVVILNLKVLSQGVENLSELLKINSKTRDIPCLLSIDRNLTIDDKKNLSRVVEEKVLNSAQQPVVVFKFIKEWLNEHGLPEWTGHKEIISKQKSAIEEVSLNGIVPEDNQSYYLNILIVDDDPNTLFTLGEIVQSANCNPILANNGKECLEILETSIPDLILLDIIMPEMDGFKTINQIKRNARWSEIPIIAVTAKAMKNDNEIILKHGFSDYIPKPVNPAFVSYKIQKLIAQLKTT
jgi:signal transduction histidine kinase/DNA-binding response OmpR family regulator/HAMP domain-containing protein